MITTEQIEFFENQLEVLNWYQQVVNVALQLQEEELYTRDRAVNELVDVARQMANFTGTQWKD